ncbi:MAG: HEPN domain-containing protein [Anaerolineales bacterium]|nr:HEPN domain-containing protein [Anaerolineales bacterium]
MKAALFGAHTQEGFRSMHMGRENKREVQLYIENAHEALDSGKVNLDNKFFMSSVNRSYYAVFYAANALLSTLGEARSKHSGVISVFRQRFIKTGELPAGLSEIYEDLINSRQRGDYDLNTDIDHETALELLQKAGQFVEEVEKWLQRNRWL